MTRAEPTIEKPATQTPRPEEQLSSSAIAQDGIDAGIASLTLTDFLDVPTLQEIQDSFTAVTRLFTTIHDAQGAAVTAPTDARRRAQSNRYLAQLVTPEELAEHGYIAPILVEGQQLGSISIRSTPPEGCEGRQVDYTQFREVARQLELDEQQTQRLIDAACECQGMLSAAAIDFVHLLANSIARLCFENYQARRRAEELSALYKLSHALSSQREVQCTIDTAARLIAETMNVKAVSIRLLDDAEQQLVPRAVHNLSDEYLNKGALCVEDSPVLREALRGEVVCVYDMASDDRIIYKQNASREGLASMLCAGINFQGNPIGTVQLFTGEIRSFSRSEARLIKAIAQLLASAIENARIDEQRVENQRVMRQLHLAADVQRRLLPGAMPHMPPFDIAAKYVPSMELGGDFYDLINLDGHIGLAVGDVVGKGVAASLLMASVRASLRAYAQDVYDLDEIIARVNYALSRDTLDNEFATVWYGVLDPKRKRLTYCNAGHEPPILLRNGGVFHLTAGGMALGIDRHQHYDKGLFDLQTDDMLLLYSDGLTDAMDRDGRRFGRARIIEALQSAAAEADADSALHHILDRMRDHSGSRHGSDDTTLMVVKVG